MWIFRFRQSVEQFMDRSAFPDDERDRPRLPKKESSQEQAWNIKVSASGLENNRHPKKDGSGQQPRHGEAHDRMTGHLYSLQSPSLSRIVRFYIHALFTTPPMWGGGPRSGTPSLSMDLFGHIFSSGIYRPHSHEEGEYHHYPEPDK